jgi:hypothetical protein
MDNTKFLKLNAAQFLVDHYIDHLAWVHLLRRNPLQDASITADFCFNGILVDSSSAISFNVNSLPLFLNAMTKTMQIQRCSPDWDMLVDSCQWRREEIKSSKGIASEKGAETWADHCLRSMSRTV